MLRPLPCCRSRCASRWLVGCLFVWVLAAPATALEPGELLITTPDGVFVLDRESGAAYELLPDEDPSALRFGNVVAGEGGVVYLLESDGEATRVVEFVPDDLSSRVVAEGAELEGSEGIAVVSAGGLKAGIRFGCGLGFELVLVLPPLMALRARRRA